MKSEAAELTLWSFDCSDADQMVRFRYALAWACEAHESEKPVPSVAIWHNPDLQRARLVGLPTGALPTFERECRFTAGYPI